ncbi:MAG TPA: hypothetical protein VHS32_43525 [Streptosporangiaceae bacterium]|jgi:hypothetical protein|nr:hypothetical protein [Streptosporangiaceae bacterium]
MRHRPVPQPRRRPTAPPRPAAITATGITISTPALDLKPGRTRRDRTTPAPPRPPTRQERVTAIITSQPPREWSGHDLAILLGVKPRNMLTQLGQRARQGYFTRTGFGTFKLNTPSSRADRCRIGAIGLPGALCWECA